MSNLDFVDKPRSVGWTERRSWPTMITLMVGVSLLLFAHDGSAFPLNRAILKEFKGPNADTLVLSPLMGGENVEVKRSDTTITSLKIGDTVEFDLTNRGLKNIKKVDR